MGGVKGTRYLLKIRNHAPRTTESQKQCPSAFLRKGRGQKSRDSGRVLSVFRLRKRYNKHTKSSLNKNTILPWKGNTKINVPKKELKLKKTYFINFCIVADQIKLI